MTKRRLLQMLTLGLVVWLSCLPACNPISPDEAPVEADAGSDADVATPTLAVATYNVRLLFDTVCDSNRCSSPNDFEKAPTEAEYQERLEQVAAAIEQLDADVVLLQEIETEQVLLDLADTLDGAYPVAVHGETGNVASVDVAVLSRGSLVDSRGYRDERDLTLTDGTKSRFAREFLRVDLEIDGEEAIVFSAHFVSKANDDPERRLAEAREARAILEEVAGANAHALIVLGGDLNDTPDSQTLEALVADNGLQLAGADKSTDELYSYVYRWERQTIDHLLAAETSGGGYVEGSVQSVHDREPGGLGGSDHGAVVGEFELR